MDLHPFTFPDTGQTVRTITIDNNPWFFANDVCAVLGIANVGNVLARLDGDEKHSIRLTDGIRGNPNRAVISEPGLYGVILRSDSPTAQPFRRWVTHEVLPSIRRTGSYSVSVAPQVPQTLPEALRAYAAEVESREAAERRAAELTPAAEAWEDLANSRGDYAVREAAQILSRVPGLSIGQNQLFARLRDLGWVDKTGQPYQMHVNAGRLVRRTTSYTHPHTLEPVLSAQVRITPKGLVGLRDVLASSAQLTIEGDDAV